MSNSEPNSLSAEARKILQDAPYGVGAYWENVNADILPSGYTVELRYYKLPGCVKVYSSVSYCDRHFCTSKGADTTAIAIEEGLAMISAHQQRLKQEMLKYR